MAEYPQAHPSSYDGYQVTTTMVGANGLDIRAVKGQHVLRWQEAAATPTTPATTSSETGSDGPDDYSSTYPLSAEQAFVRNSIDEELTQDEATCQLNYIEHHVTYEDWSSLAVQHNIATGNYPSWYQGAGNACNT